MTLADFLLARIAEDEHAAMKARPDEHLNVRERSAITSAFDAAGYSYIRETSGRVARDCAAKRAIVEAAQEHRPPPDDGDDGARVFDLVLRRLAVVYADHPEYDAAWRP